MADSVEVRQPKTPWNPSRRATERVERNGGALPAPQVCPDCGTLVRIAHHGEIYGRAYGEWPWAYLCDGCGACVGMHPFTSIPLGTLAGHELRRARKLGKEPFERLWRSGRMTRTEAYAALAAHLGIPLAACHFGHFDIETCRRAYRWARDLQR